MVFTFLFLFNIFQQFHHLLIFITFSIKVWHFPILKNSIKWYTKICKPHIALLLNGNIFLLSCLFRTIKRCSIKINITFLGLLCLSKIFIYIYKKKHVTNFAESEKLLKEIISLFHTQFSEFFRALLFSRILAIPSCFRITAMCRGVFPSCPIESGTFIGTLSFLTWYLINILGVSIKIISILSFD